MKEPIVTHIFVGQPKEIIDEQGRWTSSIYRHPVTGPIRLGAGGLAGDRVAQPYHGGPDADLCVHLVDHYRFWRENYGMSVREGFVGENFTLDNIGESEVCAGDIVRVGSSVVQVTGPRVPCANLARRIGRSDWVKLTVRENRTGFYARVKEGGWVQPGDCWDLVERLNPTLTIPAINRCLYIDFDPEVARVIRSAIGIADWWRDQIQEKAARHGDHWTDSMA